MRFPTARIPILLIARELHLGGSERQMSEIAIALDRAGFDVRVACFRREGLRYNQLRTAGVPVVQFPINSYRSVSALTGSARFVSYVRSQSIRIVHAWDYPTAVSTVPLTRLFTRAAAISSQRSHRDLIPAGYRRMVRITDRLAHGIIVNCEFVRRHIVQDEHVPERKVSVCYNGVDFENFRKMEVPRPAPLKDSMLVIGTVSSLRPEKNLSNLIDAYAGLRYSSRSMMLAIVGSGPELTRLKEHARHAGVEDTCHFEPATAQVAKWLNAIDVFVLPSLTEAFSNALTEAMACGCCVIASDAGGNPEVVRNLETGLLFPTGNVDGLAASLRKVIDDPGLRTRLAQQGERHVRSRYSIVNAAERMTEIYSDILATFNRC